MAISVLETPRFLYMSAATTLTVIIGSPSAKYSVGTQSAGCLRRATGAAAAVSRALLAASGVVTACHCPQAYRRVEVPPVQNFSLRWRIVVPGERACSGRRPAA